MDTVASLSMQLPLRKVRRMRKSAKSTDDKPAPDWGEPTTPTKKILADELQSLYWGGVRREVAQMILTLREWQQPQYSSLKLEEESNFHFEGYEHFVDQVSESSRLFAQKYSQDRLRMLRGGKGGNKYTRTYEDSSHAVSTTAYRAEYEDRRTKDEIRGLFPDRGGESFLERRARMLLQSASFLDIDKVIEYNPPLTGYNFWRRSAPPQLTLARFDESSMPKLKALRCKACGDVIRGILFKCLAAECKAADPFIPLSRKDSICETCFRECRHPQSHMTKFYKHFILRDIITPGISRQICVCNPDIGKAPKIRRSSRFPLDDSFPHRGRGKPKVLKCGLLLLSDRVMEAKYQGTISAIEKGRRQFQERKQRKKDDGNAVQSTSKPRGRRRQQTKPRYTDPQGKGDEKTKSDVEEEILASKEIPLLYRKFINRYPFGNVHVALMFGPLKIENGFRE